MDPKANLEAAKRACDEALAFLEAGRNFEAKQKAREASDSAKQAEFSL